MGTYSVNVDWMEEFTNNPEKWENLGRTELENACSHKTQDEGTDAEINMAYSGYCEECDVCEGSAIPMMSYAYPLEFEPTTKQILKVVKNTCLTIMYNSDSDEYFLALCGGGMGLSQEIGLAYIYTDGRMPINLIRDISKQKGLNLDGEEWKELRSQIIKQCKQNAELFKMCQNEWEETEE